MGMRTGSGWSWVRRRSEISVGRYEWKNGRIERNPGGRWNWKGYCGEEGEEFQRASKNSREQGDGKMNAGSQGGSRVAGRERGGWSERTKAGEESRMEGKQEKQRKGCREVETEREVGCAGERGKHGQELMGRERAAAAAQGRGIGGSRVAAVAAQGRRRWRLNGSDGGENNIPWSGQEEAAVSAAIATTARDRAAVVGLLPRSSLSSHLKGSSLLSFFK